MEKVKTNSDSNTNNKELVPAKIFTQQEDELANKQMDKMLTMTIKMITGGAKKGEIIESLIKKHNLECTENAEEMIRLSLIRMEELSGINEPSKIIANHAHKYELIHAYAKTIKHPQLANKALKAKERLKGVLKTSKVVINQTISQTIQKEIVYDTSKLTEDEYKRFEFLMNKAKI